MLKQFSLTSKMLLLTLLIGAAAWTVLDNIQTRSISKIFHDQLAEELALQAQEDRIIFDEFVKTHAQSVKLLTSQRRFNNYIDKVAKSGWMSDGPEPYVYTRRPPPWFPRFSVARAFMHARYSLLIDSDGIVREVYQTGPTPPPDELMHPTALLRELSHSQSYMTNVSGKPYLIASDSVTDSSDMLHTTVLLASPLDDETLFATYGIGHKGRITALLSGKDPVVVASSRPDLIPAGSDLEWLSDHFLVAGKSFFDYGASDLKLQFSSFITKHKMEELTGAVLKKERNQRAITALVLVLSFALILLWITGNIKLLTKKVSEFSSNVLGTAPGKDEKGDELVVLKDTFESLTDEVVAAREALERDAEERLVLERQAAEAKLKERDINILMKVMEILGVGVIGHGDGRPVAVNPVMEKFAHDCGGLPSFELEGETESRELFIDDCNGVPRYFRISRFFSPEGQVYRLVHDLTEARRAEETLRESEGRARAITETATDAIILIDESGRVTYWNPAAESIFGYTAQEAMGKDVHQLLTPERYLAAAKKGFEQFTLSGTGPALGISRTLTSLRKDGTEFPVELSLSAFQQKGKWVAVGVVRDITERVRAEEDKNAMFHMMTHDIKGPLSIIYGYCELLNMQIEDKDNSEMVAEIQKAASRISALIDDMLALSRIESGRVSLKFEDTSVKELVEQAVLDAEHLATEMDVTFEVTLDDSVHAIRADRTQLARALGNLTVNAVNYNKHGGKVSIKAGRAGSDEDPGSGRVYFEVSDTGIGIPEEDLPRVFEKYFRSRATGSRKGTGLGLAIVKAAIEAHGGSVSVSCNHGEGCTFRLELPAAGPAQSAQLQEEGSQKT